MERGFPSLATAYLEAAVEGDSPQLFALRLKSLIDTTTIRRLEIKEALPSYLEAFFASPSITSITGLKLPSNFHPNRLCPVVNALATSKLANTLTWIDYGLSLLGSVTAERLSTTEFSNLKKFTACMPAITSSDAFRLLMEAPWFYRLETLIMSVPPGAFGPVAMPNLHTLGVWRPSLYDATKYIIDADLPALRRIILYGASNLRGGASGLTTLRCGDIVELWLRATHPDELKLLLAAPWARRLEVLTVDSSQITIMNKIIDKSHCVKTLRVRRVGNFYGRNLRLFA